jgi:V8-like Glu-specific endopeptidase
MPWSTTLTHLRDILAALYPLAADARRVSAQTGLNLATIAFDARAINTWHSILEEAEKQNKIIELVCIAHEEYPANPWLDLAVQNNLKGLRGPDISKLSWKENGSLSNLEKLIEKQSTILPISFLSIGLMRAKSVARILLPDGSCGTGFLIAPDLILTNHHVIPTPELAQETIIQFNYQKMADGNDEPVDTYRLQPQNGFATSSPEINDWTAVRVNGKPSETWGTLKIARQKIQTDDYVVIIQHPGGGPKQIALYHNVVTFVNSDRIQYLTDTMPGSSGSPVFNSDWEVVGIHHSGGWISQPGLNDLVYRNEGIPIHPIETSLQALNFL